MPIVRVDDRPDLRNLLLRFPTCPLLPKIEGFKFADNAIEISFEDLTERPEKITEREILDIFKSAYSCALNGIPIGPVLKDNVFVKKGRIMILPNIYVKPSIVSGRIENPRSFFTTLRTFAAAFKSYSPLFMKIFKEGIPAILKIMDDLELEIPKNDNFFPSLGVWRHSPFVEKIETSNSFIHIPMNDGGLFSQFINGEVFSSMEEIEKFLKNQKEKYFPIEDFKDADPTYLAFISKFDEKILHIFNCGDSVDMIVFVKSLVKFNPNIRVVAIHDQIFDFENGILMDFPKLSPKELDWFLNTFFNSDAVMEGNINDLFESSEGEIFTISKYIREGDWRLESGKWHVKPKIPEKCKASACMIEAHRLMIGGEKPYLGLELVDMAQKLTGKEMESFESTRAFFHKVLGEYKTMEMDLEKADNFGKRTFRNAYFGIVLSMNGLKFDLLENKAVGIANISQEYSRLVREKGSYAEFYEKVLKPVEQISGHYPRRIEVMARNYVGILHLQDGSNEEAIDEFETALSVAKEEEFKDLIPLIEMNIGYTLSNISPRVAKERLDEALKDALSEGLWDVARWIYLTVAQNLIELGNFKMARSTLESCRKLFDDFEHFSRSFEAKMKVEDLSLDGVDSIDDKNEAKMLKFIHALYTDDEKKALEILPSIDTSDGKYLLSISKNPLRMIETLSLPENYLALYFAAKLKSVMAIRMIKKYGDRLYMNGFLLNAIFYEEQIAKSYKLMGLIKTGDYHLNIAAGICESLELYKRRDKLLNLIEDQQSMQKILNFSKISFYSMNSESSAEIIESLSSKLSSKFKRKVRCELKGVENVRIASNEDGMVYKTDDEISGDPWIMDEKCFVYDFYIQGGKVYIEIEREGLDLDYLISTLDALTPIYSIKFEKAIASRISDFDQLTNIYTRRYTLERLSEEFERAKRYSELLTLAMIDIDDFKKVNDNYGHDVGDEVLRKIADVMKSSVRKIDIVGRYGGEEFLVIFPHTGLDQSLKSCGRMLKSVRENFKWMRLTLSIGCAEVSSCKDVEGFIKCADVALYRAKAAGKNRIVIYSDEWR